MSDYDRMYAHLESLDEEAFISFCRNLRMTIPTFSDSSRRDRFGTPDAVPFSTWRAIRTEGILAVREANPSEWNKACRLAGIETDDASSVAAANKANELAREANAIAKGSRLCAWIAIAIATAALLWNILEWFVSWTGANSQADAP